MRAYFEDKVSKLRDGVSLRDGFMLYLSDEIFGDGKNTLIRVYRKPDEVMRLKYKLNGLPVTDGHTEVGKKIPKDRIVGKILDSKLILLNKNEFKATLGVKNKLHLDRKLNKEGLSLGYTAELVEVDGKIYQANIEPEHLAIVDYARCDNSICRIIDEDIIYDRLINLLKDLV